jgi:CRISPR-associated protein Cmr5
MANLEQQRANYAWQRVQGCGNDFLNLAKSAPALIMNNGLMPTLAFYADKNKNHHQALNKILCDWLQQRFPQRFPQSSFALVMESLLQADSAQYRQVTEEVLSLLRWIRQFAAVVN